MLQYLKERLSDKPFNVSKIFTFIARHLSVEFGYTPALHGNDLAEFCRTLRQPQNGLQGNNFEILKTCYFRIKWAYDYALHVPFIMNYVLQLKEGNLKAIFNPDIVSCLIKAVEEQAGANEKSKKSLKRKKC